MTELILSELVDGSSKVAAQIFRQNHTVMPLRSNLAISQSVRTRTRPPSVPASMSDDSFSTPAFLVMPHEAEQLIDSLKEHRVDTVGLSKDWMNYHHTIEKLNLQAHQSAQRKQDNFVVENFVTYRKFPTLIVNLLSAEMWKASVFPLLKCQDDDAASLRLYYILYHEAALVNLLEVAFYHEHVVETMDDDVMLEVIDYCMRKLTWLIGLPRNAIATTTSFHKSGQEIVTMMQSLSPKAELQRQQMEIEFRTAVQCVTLLRYVAERLHVLPLSIVSRLLDKHDALLSLAALIENPPWTHKAVTTKTEPSNGQVVQWKKFSQQKWSVVEPSDLLVLTTTEAQVWLAVYYLLCTKSAREHYEVTQFRKDQLLRMRKYLNDLLLDQLPLLADVQRYLDELSIMQVQANATGVQSTLVMEAVPYIRDNLLRKFRKEVRSIAQAFDARSKEFMRGDDLKQLAELYQMDGIDELLDESEEKRKEREQLRAAAMEDRETNNEDEDDELLQPSRVVLVFNNRTEQAKEAKNKPLIIEILDDDDELPAANHDVELPEQVIVVCDIDFESQKLMQTKTHRYYRYTLRPQSNASNSKASRLIQWNASGQATVEFEGEDTKSQTRVELECSSLELPQTRASNSRREKLWKQLGSLQEASRVVVQCQFITHVESAERSDNQIDHDGDGGATPDILLPYALGSLFLSVPF